MRPLQTNAGLITCTQGFVAMNPGVHEPVSPILDSNYLSN